jgi:hypothetical protein
MKYKYAVVGFLLVALVQVAWSGGQAKDNMVFAIGTVDKRPNEFSGWRFEGVRFITINADGEVDPKLMPMRMIHPDGHYSPDRGDAAQEVVIKFHLKRDASRLVFRLARGGDSVTAVTIDEETTYLVTSTMLGSGEGGVFGSYDLELGPMRKGPHTLTISMPEDGLGYNGSFRWDALILYRE